MTDKPLKTWFTVRDIEKNEDIIMTTKRSEVVRFLESRRLDRFRIDIIEYKPFQRSISAKRFIDESLQGEKP